MIQLDINCDVGEGIGNEPQLLPLISSCNIACGGHAGDATTIRETIRLAKKNNVKIGAHPSYPDKQNFGREVMNMTSGNLIESIQKQLFSFTTILEAEKADLHHIKPHGALYNEIAKNRGLALIFLEAIAEYRDKAFLFVPFKSVIAQEAVKHDHKIKYEAFGDRSYNNDLSLVSRKKKDAVIERSEDVLAHVLHMVKKGKVKTITGGQVEIKADTFCIHGDTPSALKILMYLHQELPNHNIQIIK